MAVIILESRLLKQRRCNLEKVKNLLTAMVFYWRARTSFDLPLCSTELMWLKCSFNMNNFEDIINVEQYVFDVQHQYRVLEGYTQLEYQGLTTDDCYGH